MHRPRREQSLGLFDKHNAEPCDVAACRGMDRSTQHAEDVAPGWTDAAAAFLRAYARQHATFYGWQVVQAAKDSDVPLDASGGKAWGTVISGAARAGIIEERGTGRDPNRHGNRIVRWGSRIYQGSEAHQ